MKQPERSRATATAQSRRQQRVVSCNWWGYDLTTTRAEIHRLKIILGHFEKLTLPGREYLQKRVNTHLHYRLPVVCPQCRRILKPKKGCCGLTYQYCRMIAANDKSSNDAPPQ